MLSQIPKNTSFHNPALSSYTASMSRHPLLTAEHEIELARKIQLMLTLESTKTELEKKLDRSPSIQEWADAAKLSPLELQRCLEQGQLAKKRLIESNLRLVVSIAKKFLNKGLDFLDLIQEGNLGLVVAADKYDPLRGCKFSTHSYWWIRQSITRAISNKSRTIRVPVHKIEEIRKTAETVDRLSRETGQTPSLDQVAEAMGLNLAVARSTQPVILQPLSLDSQLGDDSEATLSNFLGISNTDVEDSDYQAYLKGELIRLIDRSRLDDREKDILSLTFGFYGAPLKLKEVGDRLSLGVATVRRSKDIAMRKLKASAKFMEFSDIAESSND